MDLHIYYRSQPFCKLEIARLVLLAVKKCKFGKIKSEKNWVWEILVSIVRHFSDQLILTSVFHTCRPDRQMFIHLDLQMHMWV